MSTNMNAPQAVSINSTRTDPVIKTAAQSSSEPNASNAYLRDVKSSTDIINKLPNSKVAVTDAIIKGPDVKEEEVSQALVELNDYVQNTQRSLNFSIDDETGRTVIKVIDTETQETIRQIPSEEIVALAQKMQKSSGNIGHLFETEA